MIERSSIFLISRLDMLLLHADAVIAVVNSDGTWANGVKEFFRKYAEPPILFKLNQIRLDPGQGYNFALPDYSFFNFDNIFLFKGNSGEDLKKAAKGALGEAANCGFETVIVPVHHENVQLMGTGIGEFLREKPCEFKGIFANFHQEPPYMRRPGNPFSGYNLRRGRQRGKFSN